MNSTGHIYRVYDKRDGMSYIGQTSKKNPLDRIKEHFRYSHNLYLRRAIEKDPEEFTYEILYGPICINELDHMERYMILEFDSLYPNGFNFESGGSKLKFHSEISKDKSRRLDVWDNKDDIIQRYQNGESARSIARSYKAHSGVIIGILEHFNIPLRIWSNSANVKIAYNQSSLILKRYLDGDSIIQIAKDYNVSRTPIQTILKQNNIKIRPKEESANYKNRKSVYEDIEIIINRYLNKESTKEICKDYGVSDRFILKVLKENKVPIRKGGRIVGRTVIKARKLRIWNNQEDIIKKYNNKWFIKEIAKYYKCDPTTISNVLKENGITIRSNSKR